MLPQLYKTSGCQLPGWCVPRSAFQHCQEAAEGLPEEVSVSPFCTAAHLSGLKHLYFIWVGFPRTGYAVRLGDAFAILLLHALCPSESVASPSALVLQGSKTALIRAVTPRPAQPADGAGAAPHPGEDLQVFHFAELSGRYCSPVTFVVPSLRSPLAMRREISTSLLKTHGVHEAEL